MGYVGANGAGKTTTLHLISGLLKPEKGSVTIDGGTLKEDPKGYKGRIAYIGDESYLPGDLKRDEILKILEGFYPGLDRGRFNGLADQWELPRKLPIKQYSRGMAVKLMFAAALCRESRLMILDEATNGLDPVARREILALLQDYIEDGQHSVLFSTHIMEDLSDIADLICLIDQGQQILCDSREAVLERFLLVQGGREERSSGPWIGVQENAYGFSALFDKEAGALPEGVEASRPTVDQIVVHMIEERR